MDEDWLAGPDALNLNQLQEINSRKLTIIHVPRKEAEVPSTRARGMYPALNLVAKYDTVQIHQPVFIVSGEPARLVSELAQYPAPVGWKVVASELWPTLETNQIRRKWDKTLARLRGKLREATSRPDLVRSTGGQISLVTLQEDRGEVEM